MTALIAGVVLWTLLEYVFHRFVFHSRVLGQAAAREHVEHHARVNWFAPWRSKMLPAVAVLGGAAVVAGVFVGVVDGVVFALGTTVAWLGYEALHRDIHLRAPRTAYGRWARRHHLHHHFQNARTNFGVSTPFWDIAFGTFARVATVRVPQRHAHQFPWLLDVAPRR